MSKVFSVPTGLWTLFLDHCFLPVPLLFNPASDGLWRYGFSTLSGSVGGVWSLAVGSWFLVPCSLHPLAPCP